MNHHRLLYAALLAALLSTSFIACGDNAVTPGGTLPAVRASRVEANPNNVVSAIVIARTTDAEKVMVEYGPDSLYALRTAEITVVGDSTIIPIVGLRPETLYRLRVVAISKSGARGVGTPMLFATGAIPADMPKFTVTANDPAPGYVMFGITAGDTSLGGFYAVIVDNAGTPVWYRKFRTQVTDFQKQPNGNFTVFASLGAEPRHFYEVDLLGNVVREYSASGGIETGAHELRLTSNGYLLFGVIDSAIDLTQYGGRADATVKGMIVEHHRGGEVFRWSTFDHLAIDEAALDIALTTRNVNPWHVNAVDIDTDGNLLISFRNSDMVLKVDSKTGEIIWRLGGEKNQFTFVNDPLRGFYHQHGIRRLPNGNIMLFDNGNLHEPPVSRAVEYRLDESARTAELVWEYRGVPEIFSFALGYAQRVPSGNTLICYGASQRIIEVDAARTKRWELTLQNPAYFIYRAFRIGSID
jgi:Arylsulfotransferase (ASST)